MIEYSEHILDNGLTVITHTDRTTPLAAVNVLYGVGARNEQPDLTGMAHLLEHLMFSGTPRHPDHDAEVSRMGGEANAFTNNDFTNYYLTVPAAAVEDALDLELDRMTCLDVSERALEVQRQVVTEEYKQRYLGQPYGDVWLLLRKLCYQTHPYRWATIGADIAHVQRATLDQVRSFYTAHYRPDNAVLAVCGNIDADRVLALADRFSPAAVPVPAATQTLPSEPPQAVRRTLTVHRDVPANAIYKAYHMGPRLSSDYYACDLMTDILASGHSSRLHDRLVRRDGIFSEANAYITADLDPGLLVVTGRLADGVSLERAEQAIDAELAELATTGVTDYELAKVQNRYESTFVFSQYKAADRAYSLCYYNRIGHTDWVNNEPQNYRQITADTMRQTAARLIVPANECVLYYLKDNDTSTHNTITTQP
ncbi:MAG: insulinase family protein [Bacteroidales bacterium]|nr:insulinase family protein [Bacteroidales bacterium]